MIDMKFDLPYIKRDRDRYGVTRYYFRRRGQKPVRLTGEPGTASFMMQYEAALGERVERPKTAIGTLEGLGNL